MFADYSNTYGEYGDYGRSLRKSFSRITHAVTAPITSVVKAVAAPVVKIAKPIVKTVVNPLANPMKSIAAIALAPLALAPAMLAKAKLDLGKMKRQSIGNDPDTGQEVVQYQDENGNIITAEQYNTLMSQVAQAESKIPPISKTEFKAKMKKDISKSPKKLKSRQAFFEEMFKKKIAEMPKPASTPVYVPVPSGGGGGGGGYMPSIQMTSSSEQMQPEQSYYSQDRIPTEEGSPMQDEFRSENTEGTNYDEMDFSGYGLDMETTALLNSEAKTNVPAAIQAGKDYVAKIQGKENTNMGAIVEEKTGLNAIPTWMWLALGVSVFAMVASSSKKR